WSLGVIIFQCLTGRVPFEGEELGEVFVGICTDPIPVASQIAPDLGPSVDTFLARALARERAERFQSAAELASAFAAIVEADSDGPQRLALGEDDTLPAAPPMDTPTKTPQAGEAPAAIPGSITVRPSVNTLGPSGHTLASAPGRAPRTGI